MLANALKKNKKAKPEVQSWYKDRYQHVLLQRKLLALITLLALGCTLAMALIVAHLIPLKTIEPYVIQIDSKTGQTQALDPAGARELTTNTVVNNYFLVQYIRAREGYNANNLTQQYDLVRVMSDDKTVYPRFVNEANPNNPQSNVARLGNGGLRTVKFKSITYISPQTVQMRLLINEKGGNSEGDKHRIALVTFEYIKMNLTTEERYLNPLGFRVTDYQVTEDMLQQ